MYIKPLLFLPMTHTAKTFRSAHIIEIKRQNMAKTSLLKNTIFQSCSMILNLLFVIMYLFHGRRPDQQSWTKNAVAEAEAVASISCSGHGRAFLDGISVLDGKGKPVCECNACYGGPDCSEFFPECVADVDR